MKLALFLIASALSAQIFAPPGAVRRYAGTPTAGDCNAGTTSRISADITAIPTAYYTCQQTSSGVYEWVDLASGGGGSGDITGVTAGTGLTGGATSGNATLALAPVTASRALASDSSGYPTASSVTATELGYLSGVTGALQTQIDAKVGGGTNLTTTGAIPYVSATGVLSQDSSLVYNGTYMLFPQNKGFGWSENDRFTANTGGGGNITLTAGGSTVMRLDRDTLTLAIGKGNTATGSTLHVYDATATTGDTVLLIRDGAAATSRIHFAPNGSNTADAGLRHVSANNLGVTNGSSTTYWTLGAGGILAGTDNSIDIGANGANRPRAIYVAGAGTFGGALTAGGGASITGGNLSMNGNGISAVGALNYIANVSLPIGNVTHTTTISGGANVRIAPTYNTSGTGIAFTDFLINRTETSLGTTPGAQYLIDAQVGGTSKFSVTSAGAVTAASDFIGSSTSCIYLGASGDDGSWRFCRSGNDLVVSRRESSSWVAKGTWAP